MIFINTNHYDYYEEKIEKSYKNECEALAIKYLYEHMIRRMGISESSIGIISPYIA